MKEKKGINLNEIITNLDASPGFTLEGEVDAILPENRVKIQRSFQIEKMDMGRRRALTRKPGPLLIRKCSFRQNYGL